MYKVFSGCIICSECIGKGICPYKELVYVHIRSYSTIQGEWVDDKREGYGVISSRRSDAKYEGTWHRGLQEGCGIEIYKDGS